MTSSKTDSPKNQVTILGSGTSTGVPQPGCHCQVCFSFRGQNYDERNRRFRTSIFLQTAKGKSILVDTSPDLRSQLLQNNIDSVDAAIITHDHADHVHGIDDLRPLCFGPPPKSIPLFTSEVTAEGLKTRFPYIFQTEKVFADKPILGGGIPRLDLNLVDLHLPYEILGEEFRFFLLPHGHTQTLGFIHEKLGYFVDCHSFPDEVIEAITQAKLDLLIIDCLRRRPHSTHLHLQATLEIIQLTQPKAAGLIHLSHDFNHEELAIELRLHHQEKIFPLFDQQRLLY